MKPHRADGGWCLPGEVQAAAWLHQLGLAAPMRVALGGGNRPATAAVLAAGLRLGLTLVPINRRLSAPEIDRLLARAAVDAIVADRGHPLAGRPGAQPLPDGFAPEPLPTAAAPWRGALVLFTSGTTGAPKAARLGARAIDAALRAHAAALALTPDDAWSLPLPLDHVGGIMGVLRACTAGMRVLLEAAPGDEATGASLVPTQLARLVAEGVRAPPRLRLALVGGGPLDPALAEAARALGWPVRETYGLTEMGSMTTLDGLPVPGAQVRVEDGRILVGGPMLFDGYEEDGALHPPGAWHATGDRGELVDGRLRLTGREAELIVSGGENVAAPEVEAALLAHPQVAEACVVGLPDAQWGEVVAAAVVPRGALTVEALDDFLRPRLAGFKRPRRWLLRPDLPRTALGKLQRHHVREMFSAVEPSP